MSETIDKPASGGRCAPPAGSESDIRAQARVNGIKEIQRICDEALDHDTSWSLFCELVRDRLETETVLMLNAKLSREGDNQQPKAP